MQVSAMAPAVESDTPLGSWPHPRLVSWHRNGTRGPFLGATGAVLVKGPGVLVKTREIRGLGGFGITRENNSSSYEAQQAIQVEWS